jgi:hypothetical protein
MSTDSEWLPTEKIVSDYHLYTKMLEALAAEIRELSRKKQDAQLNLTKVKMINRVLSPLKSEILSHVPASIFLDLLDEDTLPNNSDAVLIFSQYEAAIKEFYSEYYRSARDEEYHLHHFWATVENPAGGLELADYDEDDEEEPDISQFVG